LRPFKAFVAQGREPRESLEASAVSPFSIAVKTFSIRSDPAGTTGHHHQMQRSKHNVKRYNRDDQNGTSLAAFVKLVDQPVTG